MLQRGDADAHWAAGINLIALAVDLDNAMAFDQYRLSLERAPMAARLLVAYLLEVGDGCRHFNRPADAQAAYQRAARLAWQKGMTRQYEEANVALNGYPIQRIPDADRWAELPDRVQELAREVRALRESPNLLSAREGAAPQGRQLRTHLTRGRPRKSGVL
jgi:hypothetical protein